MRKCTFGMDYDPPCDKQATKEVTYSIKHWFGQDNHRHYLCDDCCKAIKDILPKQMFNFVAEPISDENQTSLSQNS